jgi:hypothetical protein
MARRTADEMRRFNALITEASKTFAELNKTMKQMDSKNIKEATKEVKTLNDAVEDIGSGLGHLKNMWKASPKDIGKSAAAAQRWSGEMKNALESAGKMKGAMGMAAKAAGALGGIVGGISKSLLGMPGLVLMGIKAVIDTAMKIDGYVKGMNKDFARVRGPQIMTRDISKQFKDFNSAVTSIGNNLRDGLQVSEVKAFMESMTAAGLRIGTLNEGFYSYRDAVHVAAKASKVFGTDLVATGAFMGKMMIDFKMDLEDVDDSFVQVAFDAEKSGMSTDRFWNAVQNASASLSFYGAFIKGVSKNIKAFSETQVTGAEESVQAIDQMTKMFAKNATQTNMAFIEIAKKGGQTTKELREKFNEVADIYRGKSADIELKIMASKDSIEIEKLRGEQKRYNMLATRAANAAIAPTIGMAQEMGLLADQTPELLLDLMKGIHGNNLSVNLLGGPLEAIIKGVEGVSKGQVSQDLVKQMYAASKSAADQLVSVVGGIKNLSIISSATQKNIEGVNENTSPETIDAIASELAQQTGINQISAKQLVKAAAADQKFATFFSEQVNLAKDGKLSNKKLVENMEAFRRKQDVGTNIVKYGYKSQSISDKQARDAYDDTFEKVRDQTLSMEDMKNIAKDGGKWQLALLTGVVDISTGISKLVTHFMPSESKSLKDLAAIKASLGTIKKEFPDLAKKLETTDPGALIYELKTSINKNTEELKAQEYVQRELGKIGGIGEADALLRDLGSKKTKTKGEEELIEVLKVLVAKGSTKEKFDKLLSEQKQFNGKNIKDTKELIEKDTKAVTLLYGVNENASKTAELMDTMVAGQVAGKPEAAKSMIDMLMGKYGKTMSKEQLARTPALQTQVMTLAKKYGAMERVSAGTVGMGPGMSVEKINLEKMKKMLEKFYPAETAPTEPVKDANVIKGGILYAGAGDLVIDKESLAGAIAGSPGSAIPMIPETPATAAVGGAGGRNISISVTATEKDLAQRIANEVRAVLYNQHVTGMV